MDVPRYEFEVVGPEDNVCRALENLLELWMKENPVYMEMLCEQMLGKALSRMLFGDDHGGVVKWQRKS